MGKAKTSKSESEARRFYTKAMGSAAGRWYFRATMDGFYAKRQAKAMVSAGEFHARDLIVDVGSGLGGFLTQLSQEQDFNHPLLGLELTEEMKEFSLRRIREKALENIMIMSGSALDLSGHVEKATIVTCSWVIKYLDDRELSRFFQQVRTVLEPGGKFFVCEFAGMKNARLNRLASKGLMVRNLRHGDKIKEALVDAGFTDVAANRYAKIYHIPVGTASFTCRTAA
jgi:cyclopropane fatty-acyl-phospholipid synthase-like methyltransferase